MTQTPTNLHAEWSVFFDVARLKDMGNHMNIAANEEECKNLARRFNILDIQSLEASLFLKQMPPHQFIKITGEFKATVTQECIVTGNPVTSEIADTFEGWYADSHQIISLNKARREKAIKAGEELPILDEDEDPETFENGQIDLGELVAQFFALSIPQYPRAEDAESSLEIIVSDDKKSAFENPFAKLAEWKDKLTKS
jgi:uncharacterized metal-binding protein YceD (DUF177 family)